jgi:hypothetical protein
VDFALIMAITIIHIANAPEMRLHCIKGARMPRRDFQGPFVSDQKPTKILVDMCKNRGRLVYSDSYLI